MGLDWWTGNPAFDSKARGPALPNLELEDRLKRLEDRLGAALPVDEEKQI